MDSQNPQPPTPAEVARHQWNAPRRPIWPFLVVALAALLIGAAAMLVVVRVGRPPAPAAQQAPPAGGTEAMPGMDMSAKPPKPEGTGDKAVFISAARQQLIGVRTAEVEHRALETTIRTVGVLAYDETRVAEVHTKIAGWAEHVSVDFVGKQVRKGQPLFTIYSPDLVATQREYLLALKADRQLSDSPIEETREGARSLLAATRERLRLWDVTDAQVDELTQTGQPRRTLTVYSPFTGIVLERNAFPGQFITPETATFKIADLSTLWVLGQVFEYELGMVKLGQSAEIEFPYGQTTRRLSGRITFIYPEIDPQTRRAKVRIEFRNPGLEFKPASFVTVVIASSGGLQLAIPQEAVIDTGTEQYALVALADGYFEPRPIKVGAPVNQFYPVLDGLQHGDRVVTSAQFLIDSETNLRAAMQSMAGHGHAAGGAGGQAGAPAPKGPAKPVDHSQHKQ
jgi:RND family efflux transporter MFP subunit